jgi:hypothetical protein
VTVAAKQAGVGEEPDSHEGSADEEGGAAAPAIDVEERWDGHDNVDDILDGGGDEERGAGEAGHGEDVGDVVHHNVHACQLGPDLSEDADVCPVDHIGLEELEVRDVGVFPFKFDLVADLFELRDHEGCVWVAFAVDEGKDVACVVPSVLAAKPTGGLGQEDHAAEENYCRDHLEAPRDTEGSGAFKVRAPVLQDRECRKV